MIEEGNTTEINVELGIDWTEELDLKKCEKHINAYFKASKQTCLPISEKENLHNKVRDLFIDSIYDSNLIIQVREEGMITKILTWLEPEYGNLANAIRDEAREISIDWTKCTDFPVTVEIIKNWLQRSDNYCLLADEKCFLFEKIIKFYPHLSKEEQVDWDKSIYDSDFWGVVYSWVGEWQSEEWYEIITSNNLFKKSIK